MNVRSARRYAICFRPYRSGRSRTVGSLAFREWKYMAGTQMRISSAIIAATTQGYRGQDAYRKNYPPGVTSAIVSTYPMAYTT